jgi:dTDP-4-amino-4,6-dideoxygalactose transaminase
MILAVAEPNLGEEEKAALAEVVDSGWITMGDRVRAFEQAFAQHHGAADAVAVSSCTAGLHLVMRALGIGPGDEVLVPSLTFVATVNCVLYTGATPVFVDIESLDVPLLSCADAATKCTARTKAVIVMHYAGYLANRNAWRGFAESRGLLLIEDAAHAVGVEDAGTFGDAAVFSFYGNKNMTTAEGGMIVARDPGVLDRTRQMRAHGITAAPPRPGRGRVSAGYDVTMLGYNYRMDELRAAIGLIQLRHLRDWNEKRKVLTDAYRFLLAKACPTVSLPFAKPCPSAHHILPVILPHDADRARVMERMQEAAVQTTVHYLPAHRLSFFQHKFPWVHLPQTEEFARRELTLPLYPKLERRQVETVTASLAEALACRVPAITC